MISKIIEKMAKGVFDVLNFGLFYSAGEGKEGKFLEEIRRVSDYALLDNVRFMLCRCPLTFRSN